MQTKPKSNGNRRLKVSEQLRREIAGIFQEANFRNQELHNVTIIITQVDISPDFQNARVYIIPSGDMDKKEVLHHLKNEAPCIRHLISKRTSMRVTPVFRFHIDTTLDQATHLDALLQSPHVKQDL